MIAHYNKTNKTLCVRGYNLYGKVILKWRTDPLPPELREDFKYFQEEGGPGIPHQEQTD